MTRPKGKRWKRGEACVSNPSSKKHRLEAANVVRSKRQKTQVVGGPTGLGVALKNLDEGESVMNDDEVTHISALSNWTIATEAAGSLPSFEKVRKLWNSPLDSHKEVCAVLTAITEVIKSQKEEETPIAYFAALLTALETTEQVEQQTAISYLLSLIIPSVPQNILRAKFAPSSKLLFGVLEAQSNKELSVALVRSLLASISHLLSQQDPAVWSESSVHRMLEYLVQFVFHSKPKVRHAAQRSLASLSRSVATVCSLVVQSCTEKLDGYTGSKEAQVTLHTISFIRYILPQASEGELKQGMESILRVIALRHTKVTSAALQALASVCKQPSTAMTGQMQGQILMNLFSSKPSSFDHPITTVWLEALSACYTALASLEPKLGLIMAHNLFTFCSETILSKNNDVVQISLVVMEEFFSENLSPALACYQVEIEGKKSTPLGKVVSTLKTMLKLTYQNVWDVVLQTIGSLFQQLERPSSYIIEALISPLFMIRNAPDFENTNLFTTTAGHLVKLVGGPQLLSIYPLTVEEGDEVSIPNGWLLPILRDHITHSELKFFVSTLVPITSTLRAKEETLKQEKGMELDWRVCFNLEYQIWALLPSFCRCPTDVADSFGMMAKTLGGLITSRPEIRELLCSALVTLISTVQEGERDVLAKFSKNFLPILFNLFLSEPKEHDPPRKPIKDAIESYLSICPKDTLHIFYEKILAKTQEEGMSDESKRMVLELLVAMIAHLGEGDLATTYDMVVPWLGDPGNPINQKRAYQILLALLVGKTESHSSFVSSRLEEFHTHLVDSLVLAQPAAKKHRLKCLLALVRQLKEENFNFIPTILPEIVLCVKEQNEKTRLAAYKCLTAIGYIYLDKSEDKRAAMKDYFEMIIAGLTGSTHLAGATLLCLSKIVYEYNSYLDAEILDQVVEIVAAMMSSKHKEILKGVLSFIKTSTGVIAYQIMQPHIKTILDAMDAWDKPIKHHYRAKVRTLFERLLRRFGYEMIYKLCGEEHKKVVNHIVREQRRAKAKMGFRDRGDESEEDQELGDSEDEGGMEDFKQLRGRGSRSELTSKLMEGDNPLDFLDSAMIPKIYKGSKKEPCSLPEKDGKLIIEDLAEKIKEAQMLGEDTMGEEREPDSEDEIIQAAVNPFGRPKKGIYRDVKKTSTGGRSESGGGAGKFASKKASGDMKKRGKHEPFAYVSINQKKGKKKSNGQFDNLIKAGKAGVQKGSKAMRKPPRNTGK